MTKEAGSSPYTHAFTILGDKLNLSENNFFQCMVYCDEAGSVFAMKLQDNHLNEPWNTEVTVEYIVQNSFQWELASFDF